ncbi:tudor domain-containing 6 isoform X2 [Venturia canescens]|uniref:tudor domain-containing 6 isoform X2 n=1 Tax=Venturia canescens TaxID=32260 RepID=UPI001C9C1C5D|nr:tudor domain-containing 6 isoform X2 [Venturia canescens]
MNPVATNNDLLNLFVTHIDTDGPLLRLWAQVKAEASRKIEILLHRFAYQFDNGLGCPQSPTQTLWNSPVCCALFEGNYYRAKVCSQQSDGYVVQFIDYGNIEILKPCDIRILDGIHEAAELLSVEPLAVEFIVADVLPRNCTWESRVLFKVLDNLRYKELPGRVIGSIARYPVIQVLHGDRKLSDILIEQDYAVEATCEDMSRLYSCGQGINPQLNPNPLMQPQRPTMQTRTQAQQGLHHENPVNKYSLVQPIIAPLRVPRVGNYAENWRPQAGQTVATQKIQVSHHNDEPGVFRSRILEIDQEYEVTVSYVEDGPLMFSVQVNKLVEELKTLMYNINHTHSPQPLNEPPVIGSVCLGRYSGDKSLLRAVVMQVREHDCKLHYVDFGHGEILPYTDIFQLPRQYINPRILSMRFTMSDVNELRVTDELKEYFKRYVIGKTFLLHVRPPDGPPLIQYGDLYDNGRNVKDILRAMFGDAVLTWLPPRKLPSESREIVQVVSMESSIIFVQLDSDAPLLEALVSQIQKYVTNAPSVQPTKLKEGLHCIVFSTRNSQWQRAEVKSITDKSATVFYVDHGYEETVPLTYIKSLMDTNLLKLRAQAIRCILNNYDTEITTKELDDGLRAEIIGRNVAMIVQKVTSTGPIVDLYDANIDPLVNIIHRVQRTCTTNGNVHSRIDTFNEKTMNSSHSSNNRSDNQSNKWNNAPRSDPPMIQDSNNFSEKGKSNNWKTENIESRRYENRDNRYQNREKEWSPNSGQNDRFPRNDGKNDRLGREGPRYDRNERFERSGDSNGNMRGGRLENRDRGGRGSFGNSRYSGNNPRNERNGSVEKNWSDKDSDTSSRSSERSGRRGGARGGSNRGRRESGRAPNSRESDGDSDRGTFRSARMNGASARIRDNKRDFGPANENRQFDTWTNKTPQAPQKISIPPPNITVGAVKNCEVVFMKDPGDFHVQLCPDNLELDPIIAKIEATYETGGKIVERSRIREGLECVAQYSEDSKWYRAKVQSVEANGATVYFVDYGNIETVEFDKIKELDADCAKLSAQAIACKLLAASKTTWDTNDIDKFTDLTNKPLLEAEFVANESNVFEVLLREVVDDKPSPQYINEYFSDGADLAQAKNIARSKGRPRQGQSLQTSDYAALDEKWPVEKLAPGTKDHIIITWFMNPDTFYCQTLARKDEFRAMMIDIQKVYANKQPVSEPLQVGSAVMAVFSDDGALYRAEILELNKARGNIVRYIDFGNTAMVEQHNTYRVEKKYMKIPKQAVKCSLKNIVPANGTNWAKSNKQEIEKCFEFENIECTFHEEKEGKYLVSLKTADVDIAGLLVEKSLASFAVSAHVNVEKHEVETMEKQPIIEDLPRFDISLLAGQALRVKISNVASAMKFHIQLPSATTTEKAIHAYMAQRNPEVMPRLSCREVCLGAGCLVYTDEGWRRAVVINCSRTTGYDVRLIDTGAYDEIPLNCMLALPGPLSVMQNQAVECCLKDAKTDIVMDERLRDRIENTTVIVAVEEVDNNRLIVKLYDTNGKKIKSSYDDEDEEISPVCPMPILYSTQKVVVSHAENSSSVWLKRQMELDADTEQLSQLFDYYSACGDDKKPVMTPGTLCAAKSADENWYRSKILSVTETSVTVHYIDYGNCEDLPLDSLRVLEPQFYAQPELAIKVALTVDVGGTIEQQQEILANHILNQEFTATMYNVHKKWVAELVNDDGKISEKLSALEAIEISKNPNVQTIIPEMVVGERYQVICHHADSPASFWLQRTEEITAIEQLQDRLQEEAVNCPMVEGIPEENTLCLAMYSVDDMWYRAEVVVADPEIISVRFIDYGNTDAVYTNQGKCKVIPGSLKTIKRYAIKCRLDVIPDGDEDWMTPANEWFEGVVTNAENMEALVIADSAPRRVELFVDGKSVVDELVKRNYGSRISPDENLIEEPFDPDLDLSSCFVSHIISPSEFWIQEAKNVSSLETLADRFIVADMFPTPKDIKEGLLCVAKFPEDGAWYRARVVSHSDTSTEVIYIDYGNSAISTEIREIPDDVASQPAYSKKCSLALPEGIEQWSEEACIEFVKIAADGVTIFHPEILEEREDTSIVRLTQQGKDIVETLAELCNPHMPIIEERLPPLGEENSPNVLVSHVNSPSDFSVQAQNSITELETMVDHLVAAESFLPLDKIEEGIICAAKFPEDDQWYRAKILSHGDAGTEVFYIDYGNSAVTSELRVLPKDIVEKPALSTGCSLQMPEDVDTWSEEACQKFFELVNEGITMFEYEVLEDKKPAIVRLSIDGTDIVEMMSPLCAKKRIEKCDESTANEAILEHNPAQDSVEIIASVQETSSNETSGVETITITDLSTVSSSSRTDESTSSEWTHQTVETSKGLSKVKEVEVTPAVDVIPSENSSNEIVEKLANSESESENPAEKTVPKDSSSELISSYLAVENLVIDEKQSKDVNEKIVPTESCLEPTENAASVTNDESIRSKSPVPENLSSATVSSEFSEGNVVFDGSEQRNSTPLEERVVPGSINRGTDVDDSKKGGSTLEVLNEKPVENVSDEAPNADVVRKLSFVEKNDVAKDSNVDSTAEQLPRPATPKTPHSEKIVAGVVNYHEQDSNVDTTAEQLPRPTTPKTPHSEKIVAGVVNYHEKIEELVKDEILSVVID